MSEVEGGDYELAKVVENGTQQVLIPAIKDMGQTLEKVSSSVGQGADRVADTAMEADSAAEQGFHDAEQGLDGASGEGGVNANDGTNTSGDENQTSITNKSGQAQDNFDGGKQGGQPSSGTKKCADGGIDPVDVVSGQMITAKTDVELPGVLPLVLCRAYASNYGHGALFGPGWSSTLDERVVVDADGIHYLGDDAQILTYGIPAEPRQQVLPVAGARWPLTWDRHLDAIEIFDPSTGITRHFAPPPPQQVASRGRRQVRHLVRVTDRNDNWLTIARDEDGVPTEIDHIGGYRIAVDSVFRGDGVRVESLRLLGEADPAGAPLIGYAYDPAGRLVEILDTNNLPLIYEYDGRNRITAWIDRTGYRYEYAYDSAGRVIRAGGEDGTLAATVDYDTDLRCTKVANSYGAISEYWYDEHNHVTKVVDPLGNATVTTRDRYGHMIEQTDPLGSTTRFVRDEAGNVLEVHRPDGTHMQAVYNEYQQPLQIISPGGAVTAFTYDERGNLLTTTDPNGAVTQYAYTDHGGAASVTDALGHTTTATVNRAGLPISITDPLGATWSATRDQHGRVASSTDPLGNVTSVGFDSEGRPVSRVHPDGSRESWAYDAIGNMNLHTNQAGFTTCFEYGPFRRALARTGPDGARYEFAYDSQLRLAAVTNPSGAAWTYGYDAAGNLLTEQDFNSRRLAYEFDPARRVVRRTNGAGQVVDFLRDAFGQVVEQRAGDGAVTRFDYNADGELVRATNQDAEVTFGRDPVGRIVSESINDRTLTTAYDALGNMTARVTPRGHANRWEYDAAGNLLSADLGGHQIGFGHDALGRETYRWISSATALSNEWDQLGRLAARRLLAVDGPEEARVSRVVDERSWTFRVDGTPASIRDTGSGQRSLTLDALGRVTSVSAAMWTEQYAYDPLGNVVLASDSRNSDSPAAGERELTGTLLRRAGRTSYEYDGQGRVVKSVRRTLSGRPLTWTFGYDAYDRMIEAETPEGTRWNYQYDAMGRRTAKRRLESSGAVVEETRFFWDGAVLAEQEHSGEDGEAVTTTTWSYEPDSWTPIAQHQRTFHAQTPQELIDQQFHAIVADLVGTPMELVTADGTIAWRRSASLWGELAKGSNPVGPVACPLRFPGQYHDPETGLDYNYERYYDPATGRYFTPDPLGLFAAPNHHGYVHNPLDWSDPLGLKPKPRLKVDVVAEDWQVKGLHVHMPSGREVSIDGFSQVVGKGKEAKTVYSTRVRSTYNTPGKEALPGDLKDATAALDDPKFKQNILDRGKPGLDYLKSNFPGSNQIKGLEDLLKAVSPESAEGGEC